MVAMQPCELCAVPTPYDVCESCCCADCANESNRVQQEISARRTEEKNRPDMLDQVIADPATLFGKRTRARVEKFVIVYEKIIALVLMSMSMLIVIVISALFLSAFLDVLSRIQIICN